ncbi:MAG: PDZ domain-containing protein [Planctomycetota bacterium]
MKIPQLTLLALPLASLLFSACSILQRPLPEALPPLADMEEPLELMNEPDDEAKRQDLALGGFTGAYVGSGESTLDELVEGSDGVSVERIVENSPAAIAGLEVGDLILEAKGPRDEEAREMHYPSDWRALELESKSGEVLEVLYDRAGLEEEAKLSVVKRLNPAERKDAERFREEKKVGVVFRTATEVEARAAQLGPGAGAVVVGLAKGSPWRAVGLQFGDLLTEVDDKPVAHPQVVLDAISAAEPGDRIELVVWRTQRSFDVKAPVSARDSEFNEFSIPLIFSYESGRDRSETSLLWGLFGYESTPAAWRTKLLWFITFGGGEADELEEIEVGTEDPADAEDQGLSESSPAETIHS